MLRSCAIGPAVFACAIALVSGCGRSNQKLETPRELRVAVAANLKPVFEELVTAFGQEHPEINVSANFGSSGNFVAQITNKAPFDLFLSADVEYPRKLIEQGDGIKESEFIYAIGQLVVWAPKESPLDVEQLGIRVVTDARVKKVAIANPRLAPYGRAAEAALKKLGVYEELKDRIVLGDNIEQTAQFAQSGAADVGLLALSQALGPNLVGRGRYAIVPSASHPSIEQGGVILTTVQDRQAADEFRAFLLGASGRNVLKRYGYVFPTDPTANPPG